MEEAKAAEIRSEMEKLVHKFASAMTLEPKPLPKRENFFDSKKIWAFVQTFPDPRIFRGLMAFAHWLYLSEPLQTEEIIALLVERVRINPKNPYAYFAKEGNARRVFLNQVRIEAAETENMAFKRARMPQEDKTPLNPRLES